MLWKQNPSNTLEWENVPFWAQAVYLNMADAVLSQVEFEYRLHSPRNPESFQERTTTDEDQAQFALSSAQRDGYYPDIVLQRRAVFDWEVQD